MDDFLFLLGLGLAFGLPIALPVLAGAAAKHGWPRLITINKHYHPPKKGE